MITAKGTMVVLALAASIGCTRAAEHTARPTSSPSVSLRTLQQHVYALADDSMLGRLAGSEGATRAEDFLGREAARLGLLPAGEHGTYFQEVPVIRYRLVDSSRLVLPDSSVLRLGVDFVPMPPNGRVDARWSADVVYGGVLDEDGSGLSGGEFAGRAVLLSQPDGGTAMIPHFSSGPLAGAAAVFIVFPELFPGLLWAARNAPPMIPRSRQLPMTIMVSSAAAEKLLGRPIDASLAIGTRGRHVEASIDWEPTPATRLPARNVVALLPGSDPQLRGQYVALVAHPDGQSMAPPQDHDSTRAFAAAVEGLRRRLGVRFLSPEQAASIQVNTDSLRRIRPARPDSVRNGADDNASGTAALLAIAEALAAGGPRPRRSVLFLWPSAEETGVLGSDWWVEHPTVPLDSIIAAVNLDMIGRGGVTDISGGGADYLRVIGAGHRSSELGDLIRGANQALAAPLQLDQSSDREQDLTSSFCRSDHVHFATRGIPVAFLTTGLHPDYHEVSDEPQYLDYGKLHRTALLSLQLVRTLADRGSRLRLDRELGPGACSRVAP